MSEPAEAGPAAISPRWLMPASLAAWLLLVALQLGWIPFARYAWAFGLWGYLPRAVGFVLGAAALLAIHPTTRLSALSALTSMRTRIDELSIGARRGLGAAAIVALLLALWLLRERYLLGDGRLLTIAARHGWLFVLQEPGASFLMRQAVLLGDALGIDTVTALGLMSCAFGVPALYALHRAMQGLVGREAAPLFVALVASGGLARIFFGHVEVYAPLLAAAAGYACAAFAHLRGRAPWWAPPLALGVAIWMHLSALLLVPSALLLAWHVKSDGRGRAWRVASSGVVSATPLLAFVALLLLAGETHDLVRGLERAVEIVGRAEDPSATRWWVRGWGSYPSVGTDVVFLSAPHLKYLANAFHLLMPFALPTIATCAFARPRAFASDATGAFLVAAVIPLFAYACLLRPFWGPFDWDLFALTGLFLALLASHLLATVVPSAMRDHVVIVLIAFQLAFVSVPFVGTGLGGWRGDGPFRPDAFTSIDLLAPRRAPPPELAPWL